ncbi:FecR family protein [Pseudoteredinibacter isoporae]|uniref:FecR family protein n=1 Tax=Pseudoteredinibacter isoporae TaxID=570281 RepID=UPI003109DAF4
MADKEFANAANDELGRPEREPSSADLAWPADPSVDEAAESWLIRIQSPSFCQNEEQAFFQWLEASPANQAAYLRAEALWHSLGHSTELNERLEPYPLETRSSPPQKKGRAWKPWLAFATAATVAALALLPGWGALQGQQMQTGKGEQLQLSLSDGSRIQLNTQSTMQIDLRENYRLLELEQGEAYFDIAHDPDRPLIVKTQGAYVRVLGTRFNVYSDQERTQVTVVEGKVDVSTDKEFSELRQRDYQSKRVLTANEQVQLRYLDSNTWLDDVLGNTPASKRGEVVTVNSDDVLAWQRGEAIYNGSSLNKVIQDLNRYYNGEIRLQDESLGERTLVAALRLDDKDAALSTLANSLSLEVVELANGETLLKTQRK